MGPRAPLRGPSSFLLGGHSPEGTGEGRGGEGRGGQPGAPVAYGDRRLCASAGANSLPALRPLRDTLSGRVHSVTDSTLAPQAAQLVLGATFAP